MDNKKIETINKICRLAQQDADFGEMLRKKVLPLFSLVGTQAILC